MVGLVICYIDINNYIVDAVSLIVRRFWVPVLLCWQLSGCVPIEQSGNRAQTIRLPIYHVNRGETLYSIAWRFRLDYKQVAWWNNINPPFTIYRGQTLYLAPPPGKTAAPPTKKSQPPQRVVAHPDLPRQTRYQPPDKPPARSPVKAPPQPAIIKVPPGARPASTPEPKAQLQQEKISWKWPVKGKIIARFNQVAGLNISGKEGQSVVASASGKVVYAGSGLKGYGQLIIIKHNENYLSAYAHNKRVVVNQGDRVFSGQKIAEMGITASGTPQLHFEIRRNGNPVDPERYLL